MKRLSTTTLAQTPLDHPTLIHTVLNYTYLSHTTQYTTQTNCNDKTRLYFKEKKKALIQVQPTARAIIQTNSKVSYS